MAILTNKENLFIPGGLLTGMGIGLAVDEVVAGIFLGIGLGFILSTLFTYFGNKARTNGTLEKRIEEIEKKIKG